jgi:glyoxalase/bleomycin resistance protein/dioxygenase superfamily protein
MIKKLTPVLVVDAIEPVLPLWEAIGFQRTAEVPHGDRLGFVILQSGATELMYQTFESVRADDVRIGSDFGRAGLFIEVESLDAVTKRLPKGTHVVVERRKTFYGSTETIVRDTAGNTVILAEMEK